MAKGTCTSGAASRDARTSESVLLQDGGPIICCRPVRGWGGTGTGPQDRPGEPWCPDFDWDSYSGGSSDSGDGDSDQESACSPGASDSDGSEESTDLEDDARDLVLGADGIRKGPPCGLRVSTSGIDKREDCVDEGPPMVRRL